MPPNSVRPADGFVVREAKLFAARTALGASLGGAAFGSSRAGSPFSVTVRGVTTACGVICVASGPRSTRTKVLGMLTGP
jgi:hypothetical protein